MASLQHYDALRWPAFVVALGLVAGCGGGERAGARSGGDTTGTAVVTPDSAAMPVTDTAAPASPDSGRSAGTAAASDTASKGASAAPKASKPATKKAPSASTTRPTAATDTGAKHAASTPAAGKQMATAEARTAHDSVTAPSPQATRDTSRVQKAESTNSAAVPAPAPTAQQQDTSKATSAAADQPLRDEYHQAPRDTVTQAVYNGWKQFNLNCARCHGEDVLGTTIAPHLILSLKPDGPINTKELFVQTVCAGRPAKGMPAWCALGLDMEKINQIYDYVKGRSDAKIGPGRPAVREG